MATSCAYCEKPFIKPRSNRVYCGDRCRKRRDRAKSKCGECVLLGVECPGPASRGSPICKKLLKRLKTRTESRTQTRTNPDNVVLEREGNSKRERGKRRRIHHHNNRKYFRIPDDMIFFMDPLAWKKIIGKNGKWIGKYSHFQIRSALGFKNFDEATQKPPFSVIKGRHSRKIEININDGAGMETSAEVDHLIKRIRATLEDDMDLPDGSLLLEEITWKKGPEAGKGIKDLAVVDPQAVKIGLEHPDKLPLKVKKLPDEDHDPAKLDTSHRNAWEYNDEESAEIHVDIQDDSGVLNPHDPDEWEKTQRAANNILKIHKALYDIPDEFIIGKRGKNNINRILKSQDTARNMIGGIYFDQKHKMGIMETDIRSIKVRQEEDHDLIEAMARSVLKLTEVAGDLLEEYKIGKGIDSSRNRRERMKQKIIDLESVPSEDNGDLWRMFV